MSFYRPWWQDYVEIIWDRYKKGEIDRLAHQCAMGDTRAMIKLYEHFLGQVSSHIRHLETMLISDYSSSSQKAFDVYMNKHMEEGWPLIVAYTWLARRHGMGIKGLWIYFQSIPWPYFTDYFLRNLFLMPAIIPVSVSHGTVCRKNCGTAQALDSSGEERAGKSPFAAGMNMAVIITGLMPGMMGRMKTALA